MKAILIILLYWLPASLPSVAQNKKTDSIARLLKVAPKDTNRVKLLLNLAGLYNFIKPDTTRLIAEEALALSRALNYVEGEKNSLLVLGEAMRFLGNYPQALKANLELLQINRNAKDPEGEATALGFIGFSYVDFRQYRLGLNYLLAAQAIHNKMGNRLFQTFNLTNIAHAYNLLNLPDSGLYYSRLADKTYVGLRHGPLKSLILLRMGVAYDGLGKSDSAFRCYQNGLANSVKVNETVNLSNFQRRIAELFETREQYDSSFYYARNSFKSSERSAQKLQLSEASELLGRLFRKTKNADSAFYYIGIAKKATDSLYGPEKILELQLLLLDEQQRQQELLLKQKQFENKTKLIALASVIAVVLLIAILLYRANRHKQKAFNLLQKQKRETDLQKDKAERTLKELKTTQSQLIQSEKMASLGELTAGIAHEIQNPLNFVNNFSEVNKELLVEMKDEIKKGNLDEVSAIADGVISNEEKINHHGKRADAIVKGMLQHSRSTSGVREPTDINALADEYLRLAYHGLRAKDKSFNASLQTDYDTAIEMVNITPQDIGRVILNLITNAFYAVSEKKKQLTEGYTPTVSVSTKKMGDRVEVQVKDNGNGIPPAIIDKIFQPFFTTKPTGQGTGLGLSLAYDIIKAHGGELTVETKEREGTKFYINFPTD